MWWFAGMREITAAILDAHCPPNPAQILDIGCGTGINLKWLERYTRGDSSAIKGLDCEMVALEFCRQRGENFLVQGSATTLPFADETFDLVTSFDVLVQILEMDGDEAAIAEMFRVLRKGGTAFVRAAAYPWMSSGHDRAINSQRRFYLNDLTRKMENAGFRILRKTYANTFSFPLAVTRRLILKPLKIADAGSDVKLLPPHLEWLNRLLLQSLLAEAAILRRPNASLPCGLSAVCVARK